MLGFTSRLGAQFFGADGPTLGRGGGAGGGGGVAGESNFEGAERTSEGEQGTEASKKQRFCPPSSSRASTPFTPAWNSAGELEEAGAAVDDAESSVVGGPAASSNAEASDAAASRGCAAAAAKRKGRGKGDKQGGGGGRRRKAGKKNNAAKSKPAPAPSRALCSVDGCPSGLSAVREGKCVPCYLAECNGAGKARSTPSPMATERPEARVISIFISDKEPIGATLERTEGNLTMVKAVNPNSIAEKAGLMAGDLPLLSGQRASHSQFIQACKTRPLVFQVLRRSSAVAPRPATAPGIVGGDALPVLERVGERVGESGENEDVEMAEAGDAADGDAAEWDFGGVLPPEDINRFDADRCECVNCDRVACCFWKEVGCSNPNDVWLCCFDCDGGWPDDIEELGITHLTEEHRKLIRDRCSGVAEPVFPAGLPTRPPRVDERSAGLPSPFGEDYKSAPEENDDDSSDYEEEVKKQHSPAKKKKRDERRERRVTESARKEAKRKQKKREEERRRKERESAKRKSRDDEAALKEVARARAEEDASSGLGNDSSLNGSGASSSLGSDDGNNATGTTRKGSPSHEGVLLPIQEELRQKVEHAMQQEGNLLQYAKIPIAQWPPWLRELRDAAPGDELRRFAMEQPEYGQLLRMLDRGRNLVAPDSQTHSLSHICIFVLLNFNSNKRKEAWEDRLLSKNEDGTLVETCLQAVYDFLIDILVVGHGVPRENAEFLIRECTAFMDRTLETGDYDWCDKNMASYRDRVAKTDGPTRKLARKCAEQFYAGLYVFSLGEHSYDAVIKGKKQSEGPWFKGMLNVWILQTSKWSHPAVWLKKRNNERMRDTVMDGGSLVVARAMGVDPPQLTPGDQAQIIEAMSRESERRKNINSQKTMAKDRGHCIWVKARCLRKDTDGNECGCTIEASLESFDRPAGKRPGTNKKRCMPTHCCPGNNDRGCYGFPDNNGGYKKGKKAQHAQWEATKVVEVLKCCKGNVSAERRLKKFGHDGCICSKCELTADAGEGPPTKRRRRV